MPDLDLSVSFWQGLGPGSLRPLAFDCPNAITSQGRAERRVRGEAGGQAEDEPAQTCVWSVSIELDTSYLGL